MSSSRAKGLKEFCCMYVCKNMCIYIYIYVYSFESQVSVVSIAMRLQAELSEA